MTSGDRHADRRLPRFSTLLLHRNPLRSLVAGSAALTFQKARFTLIEIGFNFVCLRKTIAPVTISVEEDMVVRTRCLVFHVGELGGQT